VPTTPTDTIGTIAARKRDQPMCMPPSNNTSTSATVITRCTVCSDGGCSAGSAFTATAAPTSTSRGTGIFTRSVRRFASTAINPTALANKMISA
jgi:hypothetical protein